MKEQFTPGPWQIGKWDNQHSADGFFYVVSDSRGHGLYSSLTHGENKKARANAFLIAAAPEMYLTLKHLVEWIESLDDQHKPSLICFRAKEVLQKATTIPQP